MHLTVTDYENIIRKLVVMKPDLKPVILDLMLGIPTPVVNNNTTGKNTHTLQGKYNAQVFSDADKFRTALQGRTIHGYYFTNDAVYFLLQGKKINAIKEIRDTNKCLLKDAKDAVEVADSYLYNTPNPYSP